MGVIVIVRVILVKAVFSVIDMFDIPLYIQSLGIYTQSLLGKHGGGSVIRGSGHLEITDIWPLMSILYFQLIVLACQDIHGLKLFSGFHDTVPDYE